MYTITHRCGHTRTVNTRHGHLEPATLRFLANSRCSVCTFVDDIKTAKTESRLDRILDAMIRDLTPAENQEALSQITDLPPALRLRLIRGID